MGENLWWSAEGWTESRPRIDSPTRVLVAESFLVRDHQVTGLPLHIRRFAAGLATWGVDLPVFLPDDAAPWLDFASYIPRQGRFFPKIHAQQFADGEVLVEGFVRPAPAPLLDTDVYASSEQFEFLAPSIKGPDLELGLELRSRAQVRGFGEWIRLTPGGYVLEGALSGVLWWEGDTLCLPPTELKLVDSVTVKVIREIAAERGTVVVEKLIKPAELEGADVWIASSLHGIRQINRWVSDCGATPDLLPDRQRWESWQQAWKSQARALGTR